MVAVNHTPPTASRPMNPPFNLGQVVATPGALEALTARGQDAACFLRRHAAGDWGEICDEDRAVNEAALVDGDRVMSVYTTKLGVTMWIITEADRSSTCLLTPDEY